MLYAILDAVVDGLATDIDEIETEVFRGDPGVSRRIYELSQEVLEFQRAAAPLGGTLTQIMAGFDKYGVDEELRSHLRGVADHVTSVTERIEACRLQLRDILTVNATLVVQRQNEEIRELTEASIAQGEEVKKISAWAAILFAPTLVGTVYGMNFTHMPELKWQLGYPLALVLMLGVSVVLYAVFKRRGWIWRKTLPPLSAVIMAPQHDTPRRTAVSLPQLHDHRGGGERRGTGAVGRTRWTARLGWEHNCTGGDWSRLRSCDQGKRAEEGNDDLVNHPLHNTQAPIPISATSLSLPNRS